jgi:hypothetical protein
MQSEPEAKLNNEEEKIAYGLDRYSYQQGQNALFGFQILENEEPALVAKGGGRGLLLYQKEIRALCATDSKWVQTQQVYENKLIICRRSGLTDTTEH